jgi:hypothetical protein
MPLWASILTGLIGIALGAYLNPFFQHRKEVKEKLHEMRFKRYGAIAILMLPMFRPKSEMKKMNMFRADLGNLKDVKRELETEKLNCLLYAGENVVKRLNAFIENPTEEKYYDVMQEMKKDLWT